MTSCCKMDSVYPWQNAVVACRHATAPWSLAQERMPLWTVTPGQDICFQMNQLESISAFFSILFSVFCLFTISSVCEIGSLVCTKHRCPVYQPWSQWSSCSASCGSGQRMRTRPCQEKEGGPPCSDTEQTDSCMQPTCPGRSNAPAHIQTQNKHTLSTSSLWSIAELHLLTLSCLTPSLSLSSSHRQPAVS